MVESLQLIIIIAIFTIVTLYGIYLWIQGGCERVISRAILACTLGFIIANTLAVSLYIAWEGIHITPYPWYSYILLEQLPHNTIAYQHFIITLMASYATVIGLLSALFFAKYLTKDTTFGDAHFASPFEIKKAGLYGDEGIILGKAYGKTLTLSGFESVLVTAPTGSGKTMSIAIPNLLAWEGSGIFNDLKGELFDKTAKHRETVLNNKCFQWAPANSDKTTHRYNPFFYVSSNPDLRIRDLQLIAEIIIPAERVDGGFWYTSSREIFIMLAIYLFETKGMATLAEVHDLSKQKNFIDWLSVSVKEKEVQDPIFYQNAYSLLNSDAEKTQKNIIKDFHSRMVLFNDPIVRHATSGNDFDLRLIKKEKMSVYVCIPDSDKERLKTILTLFWAQAINLMTQNIPDLNKEPYPVLALLDEFGNMARINKLKDGLSFFRGYRLRAVILVQYLSQITSIYGVHDAKGFLNCKVKIAFALNDADDAQFFSKAMGTKTVKVKSQGVSRGRHYSSSQNIGLQGRPLLTIDEIMSLKNTDALVLLEANTPIKIKKLYL